MAGRIGVDLEVIALGGATGGCKHPGTQSHHPLVGGGKVVDPQVEVHLLRWGTVGPVGGHVIGCVLDTNSWLAVDHDHVPVIVPIDVAAEYSRPERTLFLEICGVEGHNLELDPHAEDATRGGSDCPRAGSLPRCGSAARASVPTEQVVDRLGSDQTRSLLAQTIVSGDERFSVESGQRDVLGVIGVGPALLGGDRPGGLT